jgi:hypothetical protein
MPGMHGAESTFHEIASAQVQFYSELPRSEVSQETTQGGGVNTNKTSCSEGKALGVFYNKNTI